MFVKKPSPLSTDLRKDTTLPHVTSGQRGPRMGVYYPSKQSINNQRQPDPHPDVGSSEHAPPRGLVQEDVDTQRTAEKPEPKGKAPLKKQRSWFLW